MIYLEFRGNENFLYDVQGLAMSFYPRVEVKEIHQPEEEPMQFEPGDRLLLRCFPEWNRWIFPTGRKQNRL